MDASLYRALLLIVFVVLLTAEFQLQDAAERGKLKWKRRYMPYIFSFLLPLCVVLALLQALLALDLYGGKLLFGEFSTIALHLCFYQLLLLLLLPFLRRWISARACAALWLLPNYFFLLQSSWMLPDQPQWIVTLPSWLPAVAGGIWAAGFVLVLGCKIVQHLLYRRRLLASAATVEEPDILALWETACRGIGAEASVYPLLRSSQVKTPLSIGFFSHTIRVILPEADYTTEELWLIFRHELVHLGRNDSGTKFFMTFCTALCWFYPISWIAMARSADDLELSCDETVLLHEPPDMRSAYAKLLLSTAGENRGFTTCLSVTAQALRYRLRNILTNKKRRLGGAVVGLFLTLLAATLGIVGFATECVPATAVFFGDSALQVEKITMIGEDDAIYLCTDVVAWIDYFATIKVQEALWDVQKAPGTERIVLLENTDGSSLSLYAYGSDFSLRWTKAGVSHERNYHAPDGIDWGYLHSFWKPMAS